MGAIGQVCGATRQGPRLVSLMAEAVGWLRQQPRQQRSLERIEALLDTAEAVFREHGYDNATTNLIAEEAGVPVGTLYRWFPDKAALAEGLAARYLTQLTKTYEALITSAPPQTGLLRTGIRELGQVVAENPALPVIFSAAGTSATGSLLRDTLQGAIELIIRTRVPTVDDDDLLRIGQMLTTVTFAVLGDALRLPADEYATAVDDFSDLVIAWLSAKFPAPDDPVWAMEDPLIRPLAPSLGDRAEDGPAGIGGHGS